MKYKENPKKIQRAIRHLHHGDVKAEEKRDISAGGWLYVANYNAIGQWSRVSLLTDISLQSNAVTQRNKQTNKHTHSAHPFLPWVCYQCDTQNSMAMMENLFLQSLSTTSLLFTIGILLASLVFFWSYDRQRKEPPGPRSLPLLGNLLDLKSPHCTLYEVSRYLSDVI